MRATGCPCGHHFDATEIRGRIAADAYDAVVA